MIRAVIFDYGNVISRANTGDVSGEMEVLSGVPAAIFNTVYEKFRFEFDRGMISGAEMYRILLEDAGYHRIAQNTELMQKIARLDMDSWRPIRREVSDWALGLQKRGYKLGILSNMPYEFLEAYEQEIPPFVKADFACFSCRVKLIKPEPEIYRICLKGLGVLPHEAVFFDDIPANVNAARNLGIHSFVWVNLEQGQNDLALLEKRLTD